MIGPELQARNTSADSIAHQGGKDTSAEQCTISGATPNNLTKFGELCTGQFCLLLMMTTLTCPREAV